jgi:hypothetical protein
VWQRADRSKIREVLGVGSGQFTPEAGPPKWPRFVPVLAIFLIVLGAMFRWVPERTFSMTEGVDPPSRWRRLWCLLLGGVGAAFVVGAVWWFWPRGEGKLWGVPAAALWGFASAYAVLVVWPMAFKLCRLQNDPKGSYLHEASCSVHRSLGLPFAILRRIAVPASYLVGRVVAVTGRSAPAPHPAWSILSLTLLEALIIGTPLCGLLYSGGWSPACFLLGPSAALVLCLMIMSVVKSDARSDEEAAWGPTERPRREHRWFTPYRWSLAAVAFAMCLAVTLCGIAPGSGGVEQLLLFTLAAPFAAMCAGVAAHAVGHALAHASEQ